MTISLPVQNTAFCKDQLSCDVTPLYYKEAPSFHEQVHTIIPPINRWKTVGFDCRPTVLKSRRHPSATTHHYFTPLYPTLGPMRIFSETDVIIPIRHQRYKITYQCNQTVGYSTNPLVGSILFEPTRNQETESARKHTAVTSEDLVVYFGQPFAPANFYRFEGRPVYVLFTHRHCTGGEFGDVHNTIFVCLDTDGAPEHVWWE